EANNGSAVVGRAVSGETTQIDVAMEAQRAAQQPFQNQAPQPLSKGEVPLPAESLTVQSDAQATPGGSPRYALVLYRDLHSAAVTEVGEIYGIEDVRALAALPGTG